MEFVNHTPFDAVAYEGVTPAGDAFHVLALKQTYTFDSAGRLALSDEQDSLVETDRFAGDVNESGILAESDYCHRKPRCDVIVNGLAYSQNPVRRQEVRIVVRRPDAPAPLPERPLGLNPYMPPSPEALETWRRDYATAQQTMLPGEVLLDKRLVVTGERWLKKHLLPVRLLQGLLAIATQGLWRPNPWRLTRAAPFTTQALGADYAFGGQAKLCIADKAAKRVGKRNRLPGIDFRKLKQAYQQGGDNAVVAHAHWDHNPVGRGYAANWYLRATRIKRLPAPHLEQPGRPFKASQFWRVARGKRWDLPLASLGIVGKAWLPRRTLLGTVDDAFIASGAPLPPDFDFAYWNAAPNDQQCVLLSGNEWIELHNLSPEGHTLLKLPGHEVYAFARFDDHDIQNLPMYIDTAIVDTAARTLKLTWRLVQPKQPTRQLVMLEACMTDIDTTKAYRAAMATLHDTFGLPKAEALHG